MVARGLPAPLTMTSDGAPGLLRALEEVFPRSLRIRCWVHRMRNVLGKLPESAREEVKAWLAAVRDAPTPEAGRQAAADTIAQFERQYPAAMSSFADDLEASLTHLRVPPAHRRFVRTSANALKTESWAALIAILLLKNVQFWSRCDLSLCRLVALLRWTLLTYRQLWSRLDYPFELQPQPPPVQLEMAFGTAFATCEQTKLSDQGGFPRRH